MIATWDDFLERNRQAIEDARRCQCCGGKVFDYEPMYHNARDCECIDCGDTHTGRSYKVCAPCLRSCSKLSNLDKCRKDTADPQPEPVPKEQARMI